MASDDLETLATLNYYMLEGYYRHVQIITIDATRKFGPDPVLAFYKGIGIFAEGQVQECIRELEVIKDKQNVTLGAYIALSNALKNSRNPDQIAISNVDAKIKEIRRNATDMELYFGFVASWFVGGSKSPKDFADRMIKQFPDDKKGYVLKAWTDFIFEREVASKKAIKLFEHGLQGNNDPFGYIGKARFLAKYRKLKQALETINQAVISYPNFIPALIERAKIYLALQDWDQMMDSVRKVLSVNHHHPEALKMQILHSIGQEGKYAESVNRLGELIQVIDRFEPQNHKLYVSCGQLFSRICGRNLAILNQTYTLIERAVTLSPQNPDYLNEMAFQVFLKGKYEQAIKCYNDTIALDETNVRALQGIVQCRLRIMERDQNLDAETLKDVSDHLEFLLNITSAEHHEAQLTYLESLADYVKGRPQETVCDKLKQALQKHVKKLGHIVLGTEYFMAMDPSFLMDMVDILLKLSPSQPVFSGQAIPPSLISCRQILDIIVKIVPGMLEALYYNAKVKYLSGDVDSAAATLQHCLSQDTTYADAHLLLAQIHQYRGNHAATAQYLDTALSYNFEIRDHPLYHLIKARALKQTGDIKECIQTLKMALSLPGVKRPVSSLHGKQSKKIPALSSSDRLSIFLELVEAHTSNEEHHEAAKVMQDAINAFQGTAEEIRVRIANADLSVSRGDVEQALAMLRAITPDQPYYVQAKEKMANIYLQYRRDKKLYTSCYRDLMEKLPSPHTCLLLGDAYMKIQEPEKAIEVYEQAFKKSKDGALASKIGQALIKTHDYKKAIAYYEASINNGQGNALRLELADFLLKLKSYAKAKIVLQQAAEAEDVGSELEQMMNETRRLLLLASLNKQTGEHEDELLALTKARETQAKVLKRVQLEQPDVAAEQKRLASDICCKLADHARAHENDMQQAIKYHKEALIYHEEDTNVMLELAKLFLQTGDLDACQQYCMQALRLSAEGNDQASMMMADVMFSKKEYDDAIYHYRKLLEVRPDHYEALARLIGLLRRSGQLKDVPPFLDSAEERVGAGRAAMDAGFQYCKGLYNWYCGKAPEALQLFNRARCDADWTEKALEHMIRMCLNPDQQTLGGEVFESLNESGAADKQRSSAHDNALSTAERLVKEFKSGDPFKVQVLENMVLVSTKHKPNADRALANFVEILKKKKDYVPALLGMAFAYQILKQTPRARNQLKRISKMQWTTEEAEDFEQAWLLLADVYITAGKYDMATELLKKCLEQNKSCCKAYEYLGFIYEKEQSYKDAATNYERAWEHSNETNAVIGYKLAFNYMKAKRHIDAINISHKVLAQNPNYPRMRKDILDKARASIRV